MNLRWRFGVVAGVFLAIFCLYPQFRLIYLRGDAWNGNYAYNDIDEAAYAAYVRALMDGRPRKNDPYSGKDDTPDDPQPESLFSIQFAAPYTIALPARFLGIGTPWAMIVSGAAAGLLAALAAFWLIARMTGSNWFAMASSLAVFAFGSVAAGEGALMEIFFDSLAYPYFPGFRRYIPALTIPVIFAMFGLMWKLLGGEPDAVQPDGDAGTRGNSNLPVVIGIVMAFAYCVFSYFFVWTAAAAWLGSIGLVWVVFRPDNFGRDLRSLAVVAAGCVAAVVPYAYMLSRRSPTMDDVQLLELTRAPDLARVPELITAACIVLIAAGVVNGVIRLQDRATLFALATALVPPILFNQQIVTGRSLQPIHYQVFIGNYIALLALVMTAGLMFRRALSANGKTVKLASTVMLAAAVGWGFVECYYTVSVLDEANIIRDEALPAARRLNELSAGDSEKFRRTVLSLDGIFGDDLPTAAPQNVLWARHQNVFPGLTWQQNRERYYRQLYYANVDEQGLDRLLRRDFVSRTALFGWGRNSDRLSTNAKPLTYGEIAAEARNYGRFRDSFNAATAADPVISYVVDDSERPSDLRNIEKWYELYDAETVGKYILYKARLRSGPRTDR